jgi:hypothetical protein
MARSDQQLPFTMRAMLEILKDYRDVDWTSDEPAQVKRQDSFLRDWAQLHLDAEIPIPGYLAVLMRGVWRRRGRS